MLRWSLQIGKESAHVSLGGAKAESCSLPEQPHAGSHTDLLAGSRRTAPATERGNRGDRRLRSGVLLRSQRSREVEMARALTALRASISVTVPPRPASRT